MNEDALLNFARVYWPYVKSIAHFTVFGSTPSPNVKALCDREGWALKANLDESQLTQSLNDYDAIVLPFGYGAGSKLKLYDALARGKYVISSKEGITGISGYPSTVLVRNTADDWCRAINQLALGDPEAAKQSRSFAKKYSWPVLIGKFLSEDTGPLGEKYRNSGFRLETAIKE